MAVWLHHYTPGLLSLRAAFHVVMQLNQRYLQAAVLAESIMKDAEPLVETEHRMC